MYISYSSILTLTLLAFTVSAKKNNHSNRKHNPKGRAFQRILQVWFENQDFADVSAVPGFNDLVKEGILLDNFNAITHPSEPNYVAAGGGSNFGITNDDYYNIPANVSTIYDLLENKGLAWKVYQEDIPSVGYTGYKAGQYVRKHNPAIIFDSVGLNATRLQNIVGDDQFQKDVASGDLPAWMFYTPNMLNDGHDTNASYAGNWLAGFYEKTLKSNPNFLKETLVLITFDENHSKKTARNRVWSLLLGAVPKKLKGTTDSTFYTHYSTLNSVERNWDLGNLGRGDTNKTESNVFKFAEKALHYKNIDISIADAPWNLEFLPGMMTGKSYNQTHAAV
ncbi:phosphoesterase family-domain-containing protein [Mucor mucedo]|uniref:phosphoesterase family-domain-containing protein n=1 Tax=Mucor mucedo TaxID=29922 RepID=UPI00221ED4DC|nr:phosphoesterase family-domain-containing protein [Mucor mucedo]KAI7864088.1 phosphoesterase family-domain-containing protein [Mucor mucedo]